MISRKGGAGKLNIFGVWSMVKRLAPTHCRRDRFSSSHAVVEADEGEAVPGRGEACRVALALSEIEWEDVEVDGEQFRSMQENGELPWNMLPVLQTEKGTIAESSAILRYIGKFAGLIPVDPFEAAKVTSPAEVVRA